MEDSKKVLRIRRLEDCSLRLEALHSLRQMVIETFCDKKETDLYIEANEAINEMEQKVWQYVSGKVDCY